MATFTSRDHACLVSDYTLFRPQYDVHTRNKGTSKIMPWSFQQELKLSMNRFNNAPIMHKPVGYDSKDSKINKA